jgi:DNA-binding HxlR family transcriptional regulator
MYPAVDWAVPADPYILEELGKYDGWHTAKNLEINTEFSRQWISQRCPVFVEHGLAERHAEEPAYSLTPFGEQVLNGDIELNELNETDY